MTFHTNSNRKFARKPPPPINTGKNNNIYSTWETCFLKKVFWRERFYKFQPTVPLSVPSMKRNSSQLGSPSSPRSMKIAVNDQPCEERKINSVMPQVSLLLPTHFLPYINDLPRNILRSLYLCRWYNSLWMHLQIRDEQSLTVDFFFDLTLAAK